MGEEQGKKVPGSQPSLTQDFGGIGHLPAGAEVQGGGKSSPLLLG